MCPQAPRVPHVLAALRVLRVVGLHAAICVEEGRAVKFSLVQKEEVSRASHQGGSRLRFSSRRKPVALLIKENAGRASQFACESRASSSAVESPLVAKGGEGSKEGRQASVKLHHHRGILPMVVSGPFGADGGSWWRPGSRAACTSGQIRMYRRFMAVQLPERGSFRC